MYSLVYIFAQFGRISPREYESRKCQPAAYCHARLTAVAERKRLALRRLLVAADALKLHREKSAPKRDRKEQQQRDAVHERIPRVAGLDREINRGGERRRYPGRDPDQ